LFYLLSEKEDKTNIKNGESRVTANTIPEKEHKTNIKNGESRVTGNTMPEKEDKTNIKNGEYRVVTRYSPFLIFVLSSFSGIMLPVTGFSILDICFIFFLWHSVACYSGLSHRQHYARERRYNKYQEWRIPSHRQHYARERR
jgi:hypothetical protein